MALQGTPQAGSFMIVNETSTTSSAGTITQAINFGVAASGTTFTVGTGTSVSANVVFSNSYTLVATTQNIDLTAAVDAVATKVFAKVRAIRITNTAAVDSGFPLNVYPNATNGFTAFTSGTTPKIIVPANSEFYISNINTAYAPWTVSGSNKVLTLDSGANTVSCKICIIGE